MTVSKTVQLASVRVFTDDLPRRVRIYEVVTGATAQYLTDDFVELVPPSATFALSSPGRVAIITKNPPRAAANDSAIVEFLVGYVESLYVLLLAEYGDNRGGGRAPAGGPGGGGAARF